MSIKTHVLQTLDDLNEADLARVAEFLDFLKFRNRFHVASIPTEAQVAERCADETRRWRRPKTSSDAIATPCKFSPSDATCLD